MLQLFPGNVFVKIEGASVPVLLIPSVSKDKPIH